MISRRSLLTGLIAAPAVIRVAPLMRLAPAPIYGVSPLMQAWPDIWSEMLAAESPLYNSIAPFFEELVLYGSAACEVRAFDGLLRRHVTLEEIRA